MYNIYIYKRVKERKADHRNTLTVTAAAKRFSFGKSTTVASNIPSDCNCFVKASPYSVALRIMSSKLLFVNVLT